MLNLHSVAVESVTSHKRSQRFVRFHFHNFHNKNSTSNALKIDSGAERNTMPLKEYRRLYPDRFNEEGEPISMYIIPDKETKLKAYGRHYVEHLVILKLPCEYNGTKFMGSFFLVDVEAPH